jgi:hypothetical protein
LEKKHRQYLSKLRKSSHWLNVSTVDIEILKDKIDCAKYANKELLKMNIILSWNVDFIEHYHDYVLGLFRGISGSDQVW